MEANHPIATFWQTQQRLRSLAAHLNFNTLLRGFSVTFLELEGWEVQGSLPLGADKSVLIAAPTPATGTSPAH